MAEWLLDLPTAVKLRLLAVLGLKFHKKQKKSNDKSVLVTRYYQIKELWSLNMKYHSVARELSSLVEPYNN